jgi:membrane dipeptidase
VRRANDLGLIVDVSHASDAAALETCRLSRAPVIASHSNADGVRPHARNLPDEIIRCIGEKGGVIGVNLYTDFLAADGADSGDVIRHMLYLARVGGDGVVALGTDFDGYIRTPRDVPTEGELREVWDRLPMHGVAPETVQAWKGGNFARTWEAVWKARAGGG